jgi:hypothetical protein
MSRQNQTAAEREMYAERQRARSRKKNAARRAKRRAAATAQPQASKTDPAYRRKLPKAPEMTKADLRRFLTDAVRNTAGALA